MDEGSVEGLRGVQLWILPCLLFMLYVSLIYRYMVGNYKVDALC